ncbi:DUF6364 family protein [Nitratifractor sp.]
MATKITLYSDEKLIEEVKRYAKERGVSLSKLTTEFFRSLIEKEQRSEDTPLTNELFGTLKGKEMKEEDYKHHLEEKYR